MCKIIKGLNQVKNGFLFVCLLLAVCVSASAQSEAKISIADGNKLYSGNSLSNFTEPYPQVFKFIEKPEFRPKISGSTKNVHVPLPIPIR